METDGRKRKGVCCKQMEETDDSGREREREREREQKTKCGGGGCTDQGGEIHVD